MCGIAGIINFDEKKVQETELRLMMNKMKHRGPDDDGVFFDDNVGLGFVRLSILDLSSAGHQPMHSHDGRYVIVFNGEVYNYIEIRKELESKHKFNSGTDTEVILAAYQEWGKKCLDKFNGMFAFVIYDKKSKEIFAARDRFGIKPFYYYLDKGRFIFASEIKSILPLLQNREANDKIIYDYLLYNRTDHTTETFFKGISKLNHGSILRIKKDKVKIDCWYNLSEKIKEPEYVSPDDYRELFKDSLKLRLRADVPIGVSLSGGIDSSSIVATLLHDFNLHDLNTYSAIFEGDEKDEGEFIYEFKDQVKNMHFTSPDANSFYKDFNNFIDAHNEPVAETGPYIQFKVMELASKDVKVTLDGQGADEQFAGYHYFFGSYYNELLKNLKLSKFISENIQFFIKHKSLEALKYLIYYNLPEKWQRNINSHISPSINKDFIGKFLKTSSISKLLYSPKDLTNSLTQHFEYKLEHLLRWEDLNAMNFSIESRVPFLDHRLVEMVLSSSSDQKISKGETKVLLRDSLKDILPQKIVERRDKKGFSNPREKWFRSEHFKIFIFDLLSSDSFKNRGYFNSEVAKGQYIKHLDNEGDYSKEIWKWINLEIWFRKFID